MKSIIPFMLTAAIIGCSSGTGQTTGEKRETDHIILPCAHEHSSKYSWIEKYDRSQSLCERIAIPEGYQRIEVDANSFAGWLRHLPLRPEGSAVHLHSGKLKGRQDVHEAVIDIDAGTQDLQQCADAVMRLRGEYLYSLKKFDALHFNFTSGHEVGFRKWSEGYRPQVKGNSVSMVKTASPDESHKSFRKYMDNIFMYAGTLSLNKEMKPVSDVKNIFPGDVFILGGSPGHAMIVVDVAEHKQTKKRIFLLAQSYMPAQEMHVVKNFNSDGLGAWYPASFEGDLETPEWTFSKDQLKRFE